MQKCNHQIHVCKSGALGKWLIHECGDVMIDIRAIVPPATSGHGMKVLCVGELGLMRRHICSCIDIGLCILQNCEK